jgi:hypothetical protein
VAAVTLGGGPANTGGPDTASAVTTAALRWFAPPAGSVLHTLSTETSGERTIRHEFWQSADHPGEQRVVVDAGAGHAYEMAGAQLYDPQTNTIYEADKSALATAAPLPKVANARQPDEAGTVGKGAAPGPAGTKADQAKADQIKADQAKAGTAKSDKATTPAGATTRPADGSRRPLPAGDPIVGKIRYVLEDGRASVTGHELHNGVDAWVISLNADLGRAAWTLWVSRGDGRPLELQDPGRTGQAPQTVRWTTYEVLRSGSSLISLTRAHPSARVERDAAQYLAAEQRLLSTP